MAAPALAEGDDEEAADEDDDGAAEKAIIAVTAGVTARVQQDAGRTTVAILWRGGHYADLIADVTAVAVMQLVADSTRRPQQDGADTLRDDAPPALPMAVKDRAFRFKCFRQMLAQHFGTVRVNLITGAATFFVDRPQRLADGTTADGVWVAATQWLRLRALHGGAPACGAVLALAADADGSALNGGGAAPPLEASDRCDEATKMFVSVTLRRTYLALNPVPMDLDDDAPQAGAEQQDSAAADYLDNGGWCGCGDAH
jgi:hypothetical protein